MTSSPHGPYGLGYTRATMANTKGQDGNMEQILNFRRSSDCSLQLENMKLESLVIVDQHATVNLYLSLVHTARHIMGARNCTKYMGIYIHIYILLCIRYIFYMLL